MCGRYTLAKKEKALIDYFHLHGEVASYDLSYNIAPSQHCPVIYKNEQGQNILRLMRWGLIPNWSKTMDSRYNLINARAESITEKPVFKQAYHSRRCLIPADGFYEWKKQNNKKQPYHIMLGAHQLFAMAGIWESWQDDAMATTAASSLQSFSIITTNANKKMQAIHERMPVIIHQDKFDKWLTISDKDQSVATLMVPYLEQELLINPVSTKVNKPDNNDISLLRPIRI